MRSRLPFTAAAFVGLVFLVWLRLHQPPNTVDDAYISFRYAKNLVAGAGFVYNSGERVLGTTTPAYTLLLAALSWLSGSHDFPRLALVVNLLFDTLSFSLIARLAARLTGRGWAGLGAAMLYALDGYALDFSTGGMETSFYVAAILLTFVLLVEGRSPWAGLATGLVVLIRPDGAILGVVVFAALGLAAWQGKNAWPWKEAALFAAVTAPWAVFAALYFGSPLPHSIFAKSVWAARAPFTALRVLLVQLRAIFPFSLPPLAASETFAAEVIRALLPAALCVLGVVAARRRQPRAWAIGAYLALFIMAFAIGNPYWFGWYQVPLMPLYQVLILAASIWLGQKLQPFLPGAHPAGLLSLGMVGLMSIPQLSRLNLIPWETPQDAPFVLNTFYTNTWREDDYALLGRMLLPAAESDREVAIREIGAFGYAYPGRVFDLSGLVSPSILAYAPVIPNMRQALFDLRPDILVSLDGFLEDSFSPHDPEFLRLYRPAIGLTSHALFGLQRLVAYHRADLPVEAAAPLDAQRAGVRFGQDLLRLEGYSWRAWADGQDRLVQVTLYWRGGQAPMTRDLLVRVNLLSSAGDQVYQVLDYPGEGLYPTRSWAAGMMLADRYQLKRPVPDSGPYAIAVTLFDNVTGEVIAAETAGGAALPDNTLVILTGGRDVP